MRRQGEAPTGDEVGRKIFGSGCHSFGLVVHSLWRENDLKSGGLPRD